MPWWAALLPRCFVDGRYVVQAPAQVDTRTFEVLQVPQAKLEEWLGRHLKAAGVVGFDPRLHTAAMIEDLAKSLQPKGIKLKALAANPVDRVWGRERPAPPRGAVIPHAMKYAGKAAEQKIAELQAALRKEGEDAVVLTLPDSIAWLFNIRGCGRRAQPGGAGVRDRAGERQAGALRRSGQDRAGGQGASGAARQDQRARGAWSGG